MQRAESLMNKPEIAVILPPGLPEFSGHGMVPEAWRPLWQAVLQ
jgi:hypothetical protein